LKCDKKGNTMDNIMYVSKLLIEKKLITKAIRYTKINHTMIYSLISIYVCITDTQLLSLITKNMLKELG